MKITDYISGKAEYNSEYAIVMDTEGKIICKVEDDNFRTEEQTDFVGNYIAQAINEKLEKQN